MITFENSIFINRPPQAIFDFVNNPANAHKWQSQMVSVEWTSEGPPGVGSRQRGVSRFLGRDIEVISEFTVWEPPHRHSFKIIDGPIQVEGTMKFEVEENGTKVTMEGQSELSAFFRLAEGLIKKQMERQFDTNLEALKLLLEADLMAVPRSN